MSSPIDQLSELPIEVRRPLSISTLITAGITVTSFTAVFIIQPEIPLFNSLPTADVITDKNWLLLFPAVALFITLAHIGLSWLARGYQPRVLQLFSWMTVILLALLAAVLLRLLILIL